MTPGGAGSSDDVDQLVDAARRGDVQAFGALYDRFAERVYRYLLLRVRQPADAEDLLQVVFLKALRALPRYQPRGLPFAAWLFQIARNAAIDFERRRRPTSRLLTTDVAADAPDPTDAMGEALERERLRAALDRLTADQRDVLVYRFFAGLSPQEIGALIGKREGAVRALQFRGLEALRREIAGPGTTGEPEEAPA